MSIRALSKRDIHPSRFPLHESISSILPALSFLLVIVELRLSSHLPSPCSSSLQSSEVTFSRAFDSAWKSVKQPVSARSRFVDRMHEDALSKKEGGDEPGYVCAVVHDRTTSVA